MADKDYYQTLGVDRNASRDEIKKAYKRLAKKYHPDLNKEDPNAEKKFKEVNEAAAILADDEKRKQYDQYGSEGVNLGGGFDFRDFANFGNFDFDDIFDTFFSQGFGRQPRSSFQTAGSDLRFDIEISLEEASEGVTKTIVLPREVPCKTCDGTGAEKSSDVVTCSQCGGQGIERRTRRTPFGVFATTATCSQCKGTGRVIAHRCGTCAGAGAVQDNSKIEIRIPAGVEQGTRLRIAGQGDAGEHGGPTGDLYIVVHLKAHKVFERNGNDLWITVPLSVSEAVLGCDMEIPLLKGKTKISIPAGTQPGTVFKLRGKGLPSLHSDSSGNLNVRVTVDIPTKLSKREKEIYKELDKHPKKSFLEKIMS